MFGDDKCTPTQHKVNICHWVVILKWFLSQLAASILHLVPNKVDGKKYQVFWLNFHCINSFSYCIANDNTETGFYKYFQIHFTSIFKSIKFAESVIPSSGNGNLKNNSALKGSEVQFLLLYIKIESRKQQMYKTSKALLG